MGKAGKIGFCLLCLSAMSASMFVNGPQHNEFLGAAVCEAEEIPWDEFVDKHALRGGKHLSAALIAEMKGQTEEAIYHYGEELKITPSDQVFVKRGLCYCRINKYAEAAKDFSQAIKLLPEKGEYYYYRAVCYYNLRQIEQARADAERALKLNENLKQAQEILNKCLAESQKVMSYPNISIDSCDGDYQSVLDFYNRDIVRSTDPRRLVWDYRHRGEARFVLGQHEEAIKDFAKVLEIVLNNKLSGESEYTDVMFAYYWLGRCCFHQKLYDKALVVYNQAYLLGELNKAWPYGLHFYIGLTYHRLGQYDKAIQAYTLDGGGSSAYNRGLIRLVDKKDYRGAINDFSLAIEYDNNTAESYYLRGFSYETLGEDDKALKDYSEAIKLRPEMGKYYLARAYVYNAKHKYTKAIGDCKTVLRYEPDNQEAREIINGARYKRRQRRLAKISLLTSLWDEVYEKVSESEHSEKWDEANEIIKTLEGAI